MLKKLFTSKNRVEIIGFLLFKNSDTYIREISRELKIAPSAVKREIDNLFLIGIIKVNKNRIILNEKCHFLTELKSLFIKTDFAVYPIKKALADKKIEYALIFGSFAKGDYKKESDIDLLVIGDEDLMNLTKLLKPVEDDLNREINPVVWKPRDLKVKKNTGFVKDIFSQKIIMLKGDENEIRKIIK